MSDAEIVLIEEGLKLADDALARLMEVDNPTIHHVANLLHAAIVFGEMIIGK